MTGNPLYTLLVEEARAHGFPLVGGVDLEKAWGAFGPHLERYDEWLRDSRQGAMSYLERGRDRRADPRLLLPGAKSVLSVGWPYRKRPAGQLDSSKGPRYARYLEGPDYHDVLAEKLQQVMQAVSARCGHQEITFPKYKVCVDTSAVLERSWAALAGLGWIGKNTLLIHPRLGSYFFLAEVLLDQELELEPRPLPDLCGHCSRCLQGCPTQALSRDRGLDSRRCISYLTLEKRGEFEAPEDVLDKMGPWVAGCDICQEVCPFNQRAVKEELARPEPPREQWGAIAKDSWEELLAESPEEYRARVRGSALSRVKPEQFKRNLYRSKICVQSDT